MDYMDPTLKRPAALSAPLLQGVCAVLLELPWIPKLSVYKLYKCCQVLRSNTDILRWLYGKLHEDMLHCGYDKIAFCCRFLKKGGVIYTNYNSASKSLEVLDASLSSLRGTLPPSDLNFYPPLSKTNGTWKRSSLFAKSQRQMDVRRSRLYFIIDLMIGTFGILNHAAHRLVVCGL